MPPLEQPRANLREAGAERNLKLRNKLSHQASIVASPYVMNCNVTIDSQDLALGKEIASAIRGSNVNGLKGVQTMAFLTKGKWR